MNHDEYPNDSALARELRDSLSELAAPGRPSLAAITTRGRAHQRRRLAGFAGLGVAGVAAGTALALSLTGVLGAAPARSKGTTRTEAFTLSTNANGTDTLRLRQNVYLDPAALQRALAQHGIPALVKTGTYCSSNPEPHSDGGPPVYIGTTLSPQPGGWQGSPPGWGLGLMAPRRAPKIKGKDVIRFVINPAAIPAGAELFFNYFTTDKYQEVATNLIDTSSYTCRSQQPLVTPSSRA
jgi:hypothetical protein